MGYSSWKKNSNFLVILFDFTHVYHPLASAKGRKICRHFQSEGNESVNDIIHLFQRVPSNPSTNSGLSPVELMFTKK